MKGDPTAFIPKGTTLFFAGETTDNIPLFRSKEIFSGITLTKKNASFLDVLRETDMQQEKDLKRHVIITNMHIIPSAPDEKTG